MNKATGAALCALLSATPMLVLLVGIQTDAPKPIWQLPPQRLLEYARRQPGRLAAYARGDSTRSVGKVVQDTSTVVSTLPDATVHAAGVALVSLKHASIEGLRSSLQGLEAAYLRSAAGIDALSSYLSSKAGGLSFSRIPSYLELKASTSRLVQRGTELGRRFWEWIGPGGHLHPEEFLERYYGHIVIECVLAFAIGYLFLQRSFKLTSSNPKLLTEEEIDDLCEEWEPEPLHGRQKPPAVYEPPIVTSVLGKISTVDNREVLNMVAFNFLGAANDPSIMEGCKNTIEKYGLGACGPRGFYGTIDVHLKLEEQLANYMGQEEAIIYSYDLSTIPSVLPAFANAKDLLVLDEMVDYTIQNGSYLSRAKIVKFKHNDMEDLERVLKAEVALHKKQRKPLNRRFIVVEGVYKALGDLAPLADIARLKHKYKFRLVVDESMSLGTLGKTGRGACEHCGLGKADVEIICASMGNALASVGGFCTGSRDIVDHQRLSGLGYCFSAALPPFLATAAIGAVEILKERGGELAEKIRANAASLRRQLTDLNGLEVLGGERDSVSPVIHIRTAPPEKFDREEAVSLLQRIVEHALKDGVMFTVARTSALDKTQPPPTIRINVTAEHTEEDLSKVAAALKSAAARVLAE